MNDEFVINVSGIDEACAMLNRVPKDVVKISFARALAAAAVPIVQELEPRIPSRNNLFDPESFRSLEGTAEKGTLVSALRTDIEIEANGAGGTASVNFGNQGHVANFLEYGHRIIGHKPKLKDTGKSVPAKPFIRPAAEASADQAVEAFTESMDQSLISGATWADVGEVA